jgi:4-amino-4-deoxy-L-arabinose transferase-like glycosyltransferase
MARTYKKAILLLIIFGILIRCLVASAIELGNDEVYYWTYSQYLQWNYFDHPPLVAILIRLTTLNLSVQNVEFFVRLGSIICSAFATYFIYRAVSNTDTERAGFIAALLYNASLYGSIITGIFILPDSPQMFFWTASLLVLSKLIRSEKPNVAHWALFGALAGLTIMSKIHGVFIWTGLILYIIFYKREWLRSWQIYLSAAMSLLVSFPFLLWNFQNHFITYQYHSSRLEGIQFKADNFFREIFGEIFYNNPINVFFTFIALSWFLKNAKNLKKDFLRISVLIAVPMILLLLFLAMFNDTLPHWTGPAYVTLIPLTAIYLSKTKIHKNIPKAVKYALAFTFLVVIVGITAIKFYPGTPGKKKSNFKYGEGDVTLDMYGWNKTAKKIDSFIIADEASGIMSRDAEFVSNKWFPAAHIDYYFARPLHKFVIGIGEMNDLHHFEWLNGYRLKDRSLKEAYCVVPSNYAADVRMVYAGKFKSIDSAAAFPVYRSNKICKYFFLYRMKNFLGVVPEVRQNH